MISLLIGQATLVRNIDVVEKHFGVSHWNLVLLNVFDLKSTDFPFKMF